jgi:hypothetical protein
VEQGVLRHRPSRGFVRGYAIQFAACRPVFEAVMSEAKGILPWAPIITVCFASSTDTV